MLLFLRCKFIINHLTVFNISYSAKVTQRVCGLSCAWNTLTKLPAKFEGNYTECALYICC